MARIIADMPARVEAPLAAPAKTAAQGSLVRGLSKAVGWLGLALLVTVALFPVLWALLNSLKELMDIVSPTPRFLFRPTLDNYRQVLHTPEVLSGLYNSILVVGAAVGLGALLGLPAAYAIARYPFRRRDDVQFFVLSLRFLPPVAVAIPLMAVWIDLGVYDTRFSLIATYLLTTLSTIIWLSIPAFQRVPREVEEAATIDGYGPYAVFWRIALPIASKTLLGGVVFSFVLVWNELMMALTLTSQQAATLPVIAATFTSMGQEVPWGVVNASTVLLALPPLVFLGLLSQLLNSMLKHR